MIVDDHSMVGMMLLGCIVGGAGLRVLGLGSRTSVLRILEMVSIERKDAEVVLTRLGGACVEVEWVERVRMGASVAGTGSLVIRFGTEYWSKRATLHV